MSRTDNQKMADAHEEHVAELVGGRIPRGSGNQWRDQLDVKHDSRDPMGFAMDAKSTRKKSFSVSLKIWEKLVEQGYGQRPALPIRFYPEHGLKPELDLVVLTLDDFAEMLETIKDLQDRAENQEN